MRIRKCAASPGRPPDGRSGHATDRDIEFAGGEIDHRVGHVEPHGEIGARDVEFAQFARRASWWRRCAGR
jgi:hypothetical protein